MEKILQRIILSNAFRRLKGKTQIITDLVNDNCRMRLSHTTEVVAITEDIASKLNKDITLAKVIAYSHDIGHTPFGHVGERTLHKITCGENEHFYKLNKLIKEFPQYKGFKHNLQGVRLLIDLEKVIPRDYPKWNLVLYGIANHTKYYYDKNNLMDGELGLDKDLYYYLKYKEELSASCFSEEAAVVFVADEISQIIGNIEDGISLGIVEYQDIYSIIDNNLELLKKHSNDFNVDKLAVELENLIYGEKGKEHSKKVLRDLSTFLWDTLVAVTVSSFKVGETKKPLQKVDSFLNDLDSFFLNRVVKGKLVRTLDLQAENRVVEVFNYYFSYPNELPDDTKLALLNRVKANVNPTYNNFEDIIKNINKYLTKKDEEIIIEMESVCKSNVFDSENELKAIKLLVLELMRTIVDHIAGMTDNYALRVINSINMGVKNENL